MEFSKSSIYDYDDRLRRTYALIQRDLSKSNQELVSKYDKTMISQGLAKPTRLKNLQIVLNLTRFLKKEWGDATKEDIENIVIKIMELYSDSSGQETYTSYDHKKILKIFFRWVRLGSREQKEVGDPEETKSVKIRKVKDKISREDLLTEADRTKLLHACGENARDRAFIDCHLEAGTRPGEILNLQIKHVVFDKYGVILRVDGKTGARTIRLVKSTPSLAAWLNVHPSKDDPNAPLWINVTVGSYGQPLTYTSAYQMVRRRCRIANLSKRVYLNLFRHTEATVTANYMTEAQMRKRHGWTPYSKMPGRYVHLTNSDVEEAILSHYGLSNKQQEEKAKLPRVCPICEMHNENDAKLCSKCSRPLDLNTAIHLEEKEHLENEETRKEMYAIKEKLEKEIEELKYGPQGRAASYAKARIAADDDKTSQLLTIVVPLLIELLLPEDAKRRWWKEAEMARERGEELDLKNVFGEHELLSRERKIAILEEIKNSPRSTTKKLPRIQNLELLNY